MWILFAYRLLYSASNSVTVPCSLSSSLSCTQACGGIGMTSELVSSSSFFSCLAILLGWSLCFFEGVSNYETWSASCLCRYRTNFLTLLLSLKVNTGLGEEVCNLVAAGEHGLYGDNPGEIRPGANQLFLIKWEGCNTYFSTIWRSSQIFRCPCQKQLLLLSTPKSIWNNFRSENMSRVCWALQPCWVAVLHQYP